MKERPILFSGEMVRALLEGRKTQTRRAIKPQPEGGIQHNPCAPFGVLNGKGNPLTCRFGEPGDRLWVRETWRGVVAINPPHEPRELGIARYIPDQEHCRRVEYKATQGIDAEPWRPSIHMPRWASRITLEIVSVRVERLKEISEADAKAEGVERHGDSWVDYLHRTDCHFALDARTSLATLWDSINGRGSRDANPWVWVIEFKRIDEARAAA